MAKVLLEKVRCSYVYADKTNKDGKYSVQPLIPKGGKLHKECMAAMKSVFVKKFGLDAWEAKTRNSKYKLPIRSGDEEREGKEYEGMMFFNANSSRKPGLLNRQKKEAMPDDIEEFCYSGAYFHIAVSFYPFDGKEGGKPGIAVGLNNIMLVSKGERLDGSVAASEEFKEFSAEDSDDDFGDDDNWDDDL